MEANLFMGSRVFIGLRPHIFDDVEDQHITLEYVGSFPEWKTLLAKCRDWKETLGGLPVTVQVNGYANWEATNNEDTRYFDVALIGFREYPQLNYQKNWHITLDKSSRPVKARQFDKRTDSDKFDICDTLWVGYKSKEGETKWISYEGALGTMRPDELEPLSWQ